jgi:D-glycero-D-manno-heptose 1,7-bisphosphate phosphatase
MGQNILLTDLDGTMREPKSGQKFINDPYDQQLIAGVELRLERYKDWEIIGITNQGGVAAGHKDLQEAILEQQITLSLIPQMKHIYMCPTFDGLECWKVGRDFQQQICQYNCDEFGSFRKPGPGMINLALRQYENPTRCFYIGDRQEDYDAAIAAHIEFMWAADWLLSKV